MAHDLHFSELAGRLLDGSARADIIQKFGLSSNERSE
jgi:hypothetical protein